jgi:hypothetical protein
MRIGTSNQEGRHQEVARAAAGVQQLEVAQAVGPAFELAGGRRAVVQRAQVGQRHGAGLAGVARHPPGAQRVVQQEVHHVRLGEQLGDGGQLVGADLHFRRVDLVLALGLPELVDPAQAVAGLNTSLGNDRPAGAPARAGVRARRKAQTRGSAA